MPPETIDVRRLNKLATIPDHDGAQRQNEDQVAGDDERVGEVEGDAATRARVNHERVGDGQVVARARDQVPEHAAGEESGADRDCG